MNDVQGTEHREQRQARTDIAVIGSGVAGLSAARTLRAAGYRCTMYESGHQLGGRMRSEFIDDIIIDHGLQLFNSWYPALKEVLSPGEYDTLSIRNFKPGLQIMTENGHAVLADPVRAPRLIPAFLRKQSRGALNVKDLLGLQGWIGSEMPHRSSLEIRSASKRTSNRDYSVAESLDKHGVLGSMRQQVIDPVVEAFLMDKQGESSAQVAKWLFGTLLRGTLAVPRLGLGDFTTIMSRVPGMDVQLGKQVVALRKTTHGVQLDVRSQSGAAESEPEHYTIEHQHVIVALQPEDELELLSRAGLHDAATASAQQSAKAVGCTTYWFLSDQPVDSQGLVTIDGCGRTPVAVAAELTAASQEYAPGRHLVAANVVHNSPLDDASTLPDEASMKRHVGELFHADPQALELVRRQDIARAKHLFPPHHAFTANQHSALIDERVAIAGVQHATPTLDGAIRSGQRAAKEVLNQLTRAT